MIIEVTQEDIDKGLPRCAMRCPIALAFRRQLNAKSVRVLGSMAIVDYKGHVLQASIGRVIKLYDDTGHMKPFSFEVA